MSFVIRASVTVLFGSLLFLLTGCTRTHSSYVASTAGCRNHATFVRAAICRVIEQQGWVPCDSKRRGGDLLTEVLCREGAVTNCYAAAPDERCGGWQMPNCSTRVWKEIIRALDGVGGIPIAWCGRPHSTNSGLRRVVIFIQRGLLPTKRDARGLQARAVSMVEPYVTIEVWTDDMIRNRVGAMRDVAATHGEDDVDIDFSS